MDNKDLFDKIITNDSSSNAIHNELKINRTLTWGILGTLIVLLLIGIIISSMSFSSVHRDLSDIKTQIEAFRAQHIGLIGTCKYK